MLDDRDLIKSPPERLVVLAQRPTAVLEALRDTVSDIHTIQTVDELPDLDALVLVSGVVGPGELRKLVASVRVRDQLLALDLAHLPQRTEMDALTGTATVGITWWAELPVGILRWAGSGAPDIDGLVAIGELIGSDPRSARATEESATIVALEAATTMSAPAVKADSRAVAHQELARSPRRGSARRPTATRAKGGRGSPRSRRPDGRVGPGRRLRDASRGKLVGLLLATLVAIGVVALVVTAAGTLGQNILLTTVFVLTAGCVVALWGLARRQGRLLRQQRRGAVTAQARARGQARRLMTRLSAMASDGAASKAALARLEADVVDARAALAALELRLGVGHELPVTAANDAIAQTQAITNLFGMVPVSARVPAMGGWAASPDLLVLVIDELLAVRPRTVVELGSGVSTLWLALAVRHHALDTKIVALEHQKRFADQTRALLERHGVGDLVEMPAAPLVHMAIDGYVGSWYEPTAVGGVSEVGLVLVDGPPAATGPQSRFPAVPVLLDRLADRASIILDDTVRQDEQEVARRWEHLLPDFAREDVRLQKGATVFRRLAGR